MANTSAIAAAFGGGLPPGITGTNDRCTVLVSNLNADVSWSYPVLLLTTCFFLQYFPDLPESFVSEY